MQTGNLITTDAPVFSNPDWSKTNSVPRDGLPRTNPPPVTPSNRLPVNFTTYDGLVSVFRDALGLTPQVILGVTFKPPDWLFLLDSTVEYEEDDLRFDILDAYERSVEYTTFPLPLINTNCDEVEEERIDRLALAEYGVNFKVHREGWLCPVELGFPNLYSFITTHGWYEAVAEALYGTAKFCSVDGYNAPMLQFLKSITPNNIDFLRKLHLRSTFIRDIPFLASCLSHIQRRHRGKSQGRRHLTEIYIKISWMELHGHDQNSLLVDESLDRVPTGFYELVEQLRVFAKAETLFLEVDGELSRHQSYLISRLMEAIVSDNGEKRYRPVPDRCCRKSGDASDIWWYTGPVAPRHRCSKHHKLKTKFELRTVPLHETYLERQEQNNIADGLKRYFYDRNKPHKRPRYTA
jgi:hypothetical protein